MGMICSKCKSRRKRDITLLMIGLDNAGKTTTAKHLLGEPTGDIVPTIGFSSIEIKHNLFNVTIFDLGGGRKIRGIWKNYYALVYGIIFVVDASEVQRIDECQKEIAEVLKDVRIAGKPMLLLINKQDVKGAMNEIEVCNLLELECMVNKQKCTTRVETCSALNINEKKKDKGIEKGFEWLIGHIEKHYKDLVERVERETNEQKEREEKERAERMERVRKIREEREKQEAERQAKEGGAVKNDDDDDDVIIGTPFKSASQIRDELEKREAAKNKTAMAESPGGGRIIHVTPTKNNNMDEAGNRSIVKSTTSDSEEAEKQQSSSVDLESDINSSQSISQQHVEDKESLDGRKKVKRKSRKRFKNKITPFIEDPIKPRDLPPLCHPLGTQNGWLDTQELKSPTRSIKAEKINWALAEELLPCGEPTNSKTQEETNDSDWIQPDIDVLDTPRYKT